MLLRIALCASLLLALAASTTAQTSVDLRAVVVDSLTAEPLPFANVYNTRSRSGTAATEDGLAVLPDNRPGDTLVVSYVGYRSRRVVLHTSTPRTIALAPLTSELGEVVVRAGDDYLFDLLRAARRNRFTPSQEAKTYFFLETEVDGKLAEVIEAYYTGTYDDYATRELAFKKGRIGQHAVPQGFFTSVASSRLFTSFDVFEDSPRFPTNPLALTRRRARRTFDVELAGRYREGEEDVYVVAFAPKREEGNAFSGRAWVDRTSGRLLRANLRIVSADKHPFSPLGGYTLGNVGMMLELIFGEGGNAPAPERISADYLIEYRDSARLPFAVRTQTFTRPYAYGERFTPPHFPFDGCEFQDYRDVSSSPYDSLFWADTREFRFYDRLAEIDGFVRNSVAFDYRGVDLLSTGEADHFLEARHVPWSRERVRLYSGTPEQIEHVQAGGVYRNNGFTFGGRLYADVYELPGGKRFQTAAVLDPLTTTYPAQVGPLDEAYFNIRFDLLEIERRKLDAALGELPQLSHETVARLREEHLRSYEREHRRFDRQTQGGHDLEALQRWSTQVELELGVDNYGLFGLGELE